MNSNCMYILWIEEENHRLSIIHKYNYCMYVHTHSHFSRNQCRDVLYGVVVAVHTVVEMKNGKH